jgi:hypothetical protein
MKNFNEPNDPIAQSLVNEAANLASAAATVARSRQQLRTNATRLALVLLICLPALMIFKVVRHGHAPSRTNEVAAVPNAAHSASLAYVKINSASATKQSNPVPRGVTGREKELLTELPGVPLLIVRNQRGDVTRVHVFER